MRPLIPELVKLSENLMDLGISREQLVDIAILIGTDFNEGVKGIGPKKALSLIQKHGTIENLPGEVKAGLTAEPEEVRHIFLHPKAFETYSLKSPPPDPEGLVEFLSGERDFSKERVRRIASRLAIAHSQHEKGLAEWLS